MKKMIIIFFFSLLPTLVSAQCGPRIDDQPTVGDIVSCMNELVDEVRTLKSELTAARAPDVPRGAIMAFDLPRGCPEGWSMFLPAISRTIVGAGNLPTGSSGSSSTNPLTVRSFGELGGEEAVQLTIDEMPRHSHGALFAGDGRKAGMLNEYAYHASGYEKLRPEGGSQPHNNMPPYIALHYCKKEE